jgi:hypothetical protein
MTYPTTASVVTFRPESRRGSRRRGRLTSWVLSLGALLMVWPGAVALSADALKPDPAPASAPHPQLSQPATAPASKPVLAPGQTITWSFPELPPTLRAIVEETKAIPMASVYLPTDYTPEHKFPLALFVGGAQGSPGDNADLSREIVGDSGYICVGLPSFKQSIESLKEDKSNYWMRMMIRADEGPYIWRNYKVMLEKIYREIPNIDREHTVFGGFSNGAHTAGVLLSNPDEARAFLGYFHRFVLVEGGNKLQPAADLSGTRFLLMRGGERVQDLFRDVKPRLDAARVTWSEFVMPKVGHEYSPEGMAETRKWVQANP